MKAVPVMPDDILLRREQEVDAQYERAYANVDQPLGKDFEGWENEGVSVAELLDEVQPR